MAKDTIKKKDQIGILAENMNSQFGLVMESQSILVKQIKEIDKNLKEFKEETNSKFETVFNYLSANDEMMHQLVGRVSNLEQRIHVLETKITN
jgi:polyhydroxyalkanoate synthesis regulator phasin